MQHVQRVAHGLALLAALWRSLNVFACRGPSQLPEDVKALTDCPFPVQWQPVVYMLQCQTPEVSASALKETLKRKGCTRAISLNELALRLDPASELGVEVRAAMEAHVTAGAAFETFTCVCMLGHTMHGVHSRKMATMLKSHHTKFMT